MVDRISDRLEVGPSSAPISSSGRSERMGESFSVALAERFFVAGSGEENVGPGEEDPAPAAPPTPTRVSLAQALHCLTVRVRPQAPVQFSLQHIFQPLRSTFAAPQPSLQIRATPVSPSPSAHTLRDFPRPPADNGRGVHWIPTTRQTREVVDQFMERVQSLGVRWVTFLNEPGDLEGNEYLVRRLTEAGIMPVMRVYTGGVRAIQEDLTALVRHYYQLFNEPNMVCENGGALPDAGRYAAHWIAAARQVVAGGGLPGFGALSPQGDVDDVTFLRQVLESIKERGQQHLLDRAWLSVHNYGQDYLHVREYDRVLQETLGRSLPQIGTEAGIYPGGGVTAEDQIRIVTDAYRYMSRREPYYFAYSLWTVANKAGGGHDERWEPQALYGVDGPSVLAVALEQAFGRV